MVEAVSAGAGSAVVVGGVMRRYWTRREARQARAFRRAVQAIVADSISDLVRQQAEAEARQGQHLDRQDARLLRIEHKLDRL